MILKYDDFIMEQKGSKDVYSLTVNSEDLKEVYEYLADRNYFDGSTIKMKYNGKALTHKSVENKQVFPNQYLAKQQYVIIEMFFTLKDGGFDVSSKTAEDPKLVARYKKMMKVNR